MDFQSSRVGISAQQASHAADPANSGGLPSLHGGSHQNRSLSHDKGKNQFKAGGLV